VNVLRLCWLGVRAHEHEAMVGVLRDVMGLTPELVEPETTELSLPSGDRVQVFGPGHPYFQFLGRHASGPVPLFEVDDVQRARAELVAAGLEVIGEIEDDGTWEWLHFRGPDGNLYELASRKRA
jgi:catechol 2,3-dioxygenase-like lactoylglutathione lyase family enzyme